MKRTDKQPSHENVSCVSFFGGGVGPSSLGMSAILWPDVPTLLMGDDERGAVCRIIGRGNRNARMKPAVVPRHASQILHNLIRARTLAAVVGIQ
jgi:hypothetical protein